MLAYKMTPYYRAGALTPWGGNRLKTLFGKQTPDERTGESLEASTLPGRESLGPDGRTLTEIAGAELPLMLKLLDARETLSVQVHPDDAYARRAEGKLGKAEAWLILHAEPEAKLVYGLLPGTKTESITPERIEARLRWIPVQAGDILNILPGMVHAVGPGIVLYEIQQTSDVTYRIFDWGRRDHEGKPRELHLRQAADVVKTDLLPPKLRGELVAMEGGTATHCLTNEHFTLSVLHAAGRLRLPGRGGFAFLTALCGGTLERGSEIIRFARGETYFLPHDFPDFYVAADGDLIISGNVT